MVPEEDNNDSIERLFQQKAKEYDISYQEEDWLKLEKQLDQHDTMITNRRKRWFIAAAVLLVFSLLGYAIYQNSQEIDHLHEQLQEQELTQNSQDNEPNISDSIEPDTPVDPKSNKPSSLSAENKKLPGNITSSGSKSSSRKELDPSTQSTEFIVRGSAIQETTGGELPCSNCLLGNIANYQQISTAPRSTQLDPLSSSAQLVAIEEEKELPSPAPTKPTVHTLPNISKASVGFLAGPDLSTAGSLSDFHSPGYSLGLTLAYRLSPNISIQAGFIRSVSRYIAGSSNYHPPENFWGYSAVADKTIAECAIIDIPLSIKYDWAHFDRSRLFATAGISSYIMLSEDYQFEYNSADSDQVAGWYGETGTRHWSSNINLSIGYEYDLNDRFSLRAEPFLKLPVREVGWGNVKLYSLGSFISFNYNLY